MNSINSRPLPQFIRDLLGSPPPRGTGLHNWIFKIARQLHAHRPEEEIISLLEVVLLDSGVKTGEIADAVHNSKGVAWQPGAARLTTPAKRWPDVDQALRKQIIADGCGVAGLRGASPHRPDEPTRGTEYFVDILFPGNSLLCCGSATDRFATKPREEWRGHMAELQFIVPSPMSTLTGKTQDGKTSARCLTNTGSRRFLVVEFDSGQQDDHAAVLLHLAERAPLALVVHSGNKSLHGWYFCHGCDSEVLRSFFSYAVGLGADPAIFTLCQLVRMPGGLRDNGKTQQVLFLNPEVIT